MDFDMTVFGGLVLPMVVAACLCFGYIIKQWLPERYDKLIPTVLAAVGAVLACVTQRSVSVEILVSGMFSGLASTGLHQAFKQLIEKK